jgi:hypothetical protein
LENYGEDTHSRTTTVTEKTPLRDETGVIAYWVTFKCFRKRFFVARAGPPSFSTYPRDPLIFDQLKYISEGDTIEITYTGQQNLEKLVSVRLANGAEDNSQMEQ